MTARTRLEPLASDSEWSRVWEVPQSTTLLDLLAPADVAPDLSAFTFVDHGGPVESLTWDRLRRASAGRARQLAQAGVMRGDRVVLMLPTCPAFFEAFFGVLYLGAIPVPVSPPHSVRPEKLAVLFATLTRIVDDCQARVLVGLDRPLGLLDSYLRDYGRALRLVSVEQPAQATPPPSEALADPSDLALLQYTSGSTSAPKGVVLTHANIIANARAISEAVADRSTRAVCWLPLHHDMGLIGGALTALYSRSRQVLMPPQAFARHPARWLQYLSDVRATVMLAPNFAYAFCAKSIAPEDLAGVDLGAVAVAMNGAEPIDPATIEAFETRFAPFGLRPGTVRPVYGLAECALAVTFGEPGRARIDGVAADALERNGWALPVTGAERARRFVSVGRPLSAVAVRVVDGAGADLPERRIGEVVVRGPSVMRGYYGKPVESAEVLRNGWLHTGDLGYIAAGHLYITGRSKDLIIRFGRNYHAQDIERAAAEVPGLLPGGIAAFGLDHPDGTRIVVMAETRRLDAETQAELTARIRAACHRHFDTGPDDIWLVAPGAIPRTTSGKVRRHACRQAYEARDILELAGSPAPDPV